jgi:hypothetical protein
MLCDRPQWAKGFCPSHYSSYIRPKKGYRSNKTCACGCGTRLKDDRSVWAKGHNLINPNGYQTSGYVYQHILLHPRKQRTNNRIGQHILIAEKVLGKYLPQKSIVHHIDGNGHNNENSNLVICENRAYHQLLHARQRAYNAVGDVQQRPCVVCGKYSPIIELSYRNGRKDQNCWWHGECMSKVYKQQYLQKLKRKGVNHDNNNDT